MKGQDLIERFVKEASHFDMKHAERFLKVCSKVVPFIKEHHPKWHGSSEENVCNYLAWYWNRDLMAVSWSGDHVYGVCLIKLFDRLEDWLEDLPHHPTGNFGMVDLLISISPSATLELYEILFERWGPQKVVMWERGERTLDKAPRMVTWAGYKKLLRRMTLTTGNVLYG
jgi:hypothetical protein